MVGRKKIDPLNVKPAAQKFITRFVAAALTLSVVLSMYSSCAVTKMMLLKKKSINPVAVIATASQVTQISKDYLVASLSARTDSDPMNVGGVVNNRGIPDLPTGDQSGYNVTDVYLRSQSIKPSALKIGVEKKLVNEWVSVFGVKSASANDDKSVTRFFIVRCLQAGSTITILSLPSPTPTDPLRKLVLDPAYSKAVPNQSALNIAMKNFITNYFVVGTDGAHTDLWRVYVSKNFDTTVSAPSYFTSINVTSIMATTNFFESRVKVGQKIYLQANLQGYNGEETFSLFSVFLTAVYSSNHQWLVDCLDNFIALQ